MRQYPCSTHGSKYRRLDGGGRESTCLFVCFVYCFSLSCFAMLRVLAFVSLPCVFVWLVELLTADHTISLSFNPTGVSFVGQDVRLWGKLPVLRRNNLAM